MRIATSIIIGNETGLSERVRELVDSLQGLCSELLTYPSVDAIPNLLRPDVKLVILHHETAAQSVPIRALLKAIHASNKHVPVIVLSDETQKCQMLAWLKLGARDCLLDTVDFAHLSLLVDSLTLQARYGGGDENWLTAPGVDRFCVAAPQMFELARQIPRIAVSSANTLVTGETGTGKTHLAQLVHALSKRARKPFLAVNCAAIPEMLVESELFGHQQGAFTGADKDRAGVFSRVGGGTLFLDEVDALPFGSQAKLLHAVEGRGFLPVGSQSHSTNKFKGRLIFATNQDLPTLVRSRDFRGDLYYRLAILELHVPPLRARRAEIRYLAEEFIRTAGRRDGCRCRSLGPAALALLEAYNWPGNVRELHNVLTRAMTFSLSEQVQADDLPVSMLVRTDARDDSQVDVRPDRIDAASLPNALVAKTGFPPLEQARMEGEIQALNDVLAANSNNRTMAARQLGISRSALYKRIQKLGLSPQF